MERRRVRKRLWSAFTKQIEKQRKVSKKVIHETRMVLQPSCHMRIVAARGSSGILAWSRSTWASAPDIAQSKFIAKILHRMIIEHIYKHTQTAIDYNSHRWQHGKRQTANSDHTHSRGFGRDARVEDLAQAYTCNPRLPLWTASPKWCLRAQIEKQRKRDWTTVKISNKERNEIYYCGSTSYGLCDKFKSHAHAHTQFLSLSW